MAELGLSSRFKKCIDIVSKFGRVCIRQPGMPVSLTIQTRLVIDGIPVPVKDSAAHLGDQFNSRGTNKALIEERVKKGKG